MSTPLSSCLSNSVSGHQCVDHPPPGCPSTTNHRGLNCDWSYPCNNLMICHSEETSVPSQNKGLNQVPLFHSVSQKGPYTTICYRLRQTVEGSLHTPRVMTYRTTVETGVETKDPFASRRGFLERMLPKEFPN